MLITSFDANVEVLNVSSEMMMMMMMMMIIIIIIIIIIIVTWIISSSTVLAEYLKKPKGSALYMLPIIAIMNWHVFYILRVLLYKSSVTKISASLALC